jgi:hypothetical protein
MWIRTQDKEKLLKVDFFELDETRIYCNIADNGGYNYVFLGQYSTKEKALKVLDIIQEHINNMYIGLADYMGKPFQMPQDSEVD